MVKAIKKTRQISNSKKKTHLFSYCNQTGDALHGQMQQALSFDEKKRVFGKSAVRLSTFYLFKSAGFTVVVCSYSNNNMSQTAVKALSETPKARALALFLNLLLLLP